MEEEQLSPKIDSKDTNNGVSSRTHPPQYFQLIQKVGTHGCYQHIILAVSLALYFVNSIATYSTSFIFMNPEFDCVKMGLAVENCENYVCENYSRKEIEEFPRKIMYETIATQFGPFYCSDITRLSAYRAIQSISAFIGISLAITLSDNFSRKNTLLLCLGIITIGHLLLACSINIPMICFSQFLIGFGLNPPLRISQTIIAEQTDKTKRDGRLVLCLLPFCLGQTLIGSIFDIFKQWRLFILFFEFLPLFILTLVTYFFIEDSPKYLLMKGEKEAIEILNKISRINEQQYRYKMGDINQYLKYEEQYEELKSAVSPLDIFRYRSLRVGSILFCIIFFGVDFFYYAYNAMINKIGFNLIINSYLFGISAIAAVPLAYLLSPIISRKLSGIVNYSILFFINFFLIFYQVPDTCIECDRRYVQMGLLMLVQFCFNFQTMIVYVHLSQFFPVAVRTIGMGMPTLAGSMAMYISQFFIVNSFQVSLTLPFLIISVVSFTAGTCYAFAPQTLNIPVEDQIAQIKDQHEMLYKLNTNNIRNEQSG